MWENQSIVGQGILKMVGHLGKGACMCLWWEVKKAKRLDPKTNVSLSNNILTIFVMVSHSLFRTCYHVGLWGKKKIVFPLFDILY